METYCGPHQSSIGKRLARRNCTIIRSAGDHESMGPIGVAPQSMERISSPISPPPCSQAWSDLSGGRLGRWSMDIRFPERTHVEMSVGRQRTAHLVLNQDARRPDSARPQREKQPPGRFGRCGGGPVAGACRGARIALDGIMSKSMPPNHQLFTGWSMQPVTFVRTALSIALGASLSAQSSLSLDAVSTRIDPYVDKPRVVVMTDIANEPDDQMSMVRFLVYANQYDVEGLIASTSTWMRNKVRPDVINSVLDSYSQVQPNLSKHERGFPSADVLRKVVVSGQPGFGMAAVGEGRQSAGANLIIAAAERSDPRPLWVLAWGGANTLAQALLQAKTTRTPQQLDALVSKLRVYAISDQDDAGP